MGIGQSSTVWLPELDQDLPLCRMLQQVQALCFGLQLIGACERCRLTQPLHCDPAQSGDAVLSSPHL